MGRRRCLIRYLDRNGVVAVRHNDVVVMVKIYRTGLFAVNWELWDVRVLPRRVRSGVVLPGREFIAHSLIGRGHAPSRVSAIVRTNLLIPRLFH